MTIRTKIRICIAVGCVAILLGNRTLIPRKAFLKFLGEEAEG